MTTASYIYLEGRMEEYMRGCYLGPYLNQPDCASLNLQTGGIQRLPETKHAGVWQLATGKNKAQYS
jgi:hypothetical protein